MTKIMENDMDVECILTGEVDALDFMALAYNFAIRKHGEQKRKYSGEPYHLHCLEVATLIQDAGIHDPHIIAAALLHDTIEDTMTTAQEIERFFGAEVANLVLEVTDVSRPEDGNRKHRKFLDLVHLSKASPEGQTIKLADIISNTSSIIAHDKNFARVYIPEKEQLLRVLDRGDSTLYRMAEQMVRDARDTLERERKEE